MGLFDALAAQTPEGEALRAGLLGMGTGLLSGSVGYGGAFAPALAQGFAGFAAGTQGAAENQQRQQLLAQRQQEAELKRRQQEAELAQQQQFQGFFRPGLAPGLQAPAQGGAPAGSTADGLRRRVEQAMMSGNPMLVDWASKAAGLLPKEGSRRTQFDANSGMLIDLDAGVATPVQTPSGPYQPKEKWQFDPVRGVRVNAETGMAAPILGEDGQPLPAQNTLEKPLNEGQSKDLLFGSRAAEANRIINSVTPDLNLLAAQAFNSEGFMGNVRNWLAPADVQKFNQAKRDFINAVLRKESGAVISQEEFANAELQYFPQPGDTKEVIAQKAANRQLAIDGILAGVPADRRNSLIQGGQAQRAGQPQSGDYSTLWGG